MKTSWTLAVTHDGGTTRKRFASELPDGTDPVEALFDVVADSGYYLCLGNIAAVVIEDFAVDGAVLLRDADGAAVVNSCRGCGEDFVVTVPMAQLHLDETNEAYPDEPVTSLVEAANTLDICPACSGV